MKKINTDKKNKIVIFLATILILSQFRLIDHPWNFTPILAFGILSGYYLKNVAYGYSLIILSMFLGDLFIGFHNLIFFTYFGLLFSVIIGKYIKQLNFVPILSSSIGSAVLFFIISNFGVWLLSGTYTINFQGLINCYIAAIPFFRGTLLSTIIFVFVLKWIFDLLKFYPTFIEQKI